MTKNQNIMIIIFPIIVMQLNKEMMDFFDLWSSQYAQLIYWTSWSISACIIFLYGVFPRVNSWKFKEIDKKLDNSAELYRSELYLLSWREILKKLGMYVE